MGHDATKVLMGSTRSSYRHATPKVAAIEAGVVGRAKSDGTITTVLGDGAIHGVSLGKDLSNAGRTAFVRSGLGVPLLLTAAFTPVVGAVVNISDTTGKGGAAGAGFTATRGVYASNELTAVKEDGTEVAAGVAYIDMPGGL